MSKGLKVILIVIGVYLSIAFLHVWLNIGFGHLGLVASHQTEDKFRVGFLPVT